MARRLKGSSGKSSGGKGRKPAPGGVASGKGKRGEQVKDDSLVRHTGGDPRKPDAAEPERTKTPDRSKVKDRPAAVTASGAAARPSSSRRPAAASGAKATGSKATGAMAGGAKASAAKRAAADPAVAHRTSYGKKTTGAGGTSATGVSRKARTNSRTQRPEPGSAPGSVPVARAAGGRTRDAEPAAATVETGAEGVVEVASFPAEPREAGLRQEGFRSGFACFVGRPNAGKSTLTNALVGEKVAITSNRPQTTRRAIRGIVHREDAQIVLVDTPGLHRPRTLLGQRLNDLVRQTLTEVDVIGFCLPADQEIGPGDRFIAKELNELSASRRRPAPVLALATKADAVDRARLAEHLLAIGELLPDAEVIPVSAVDGFQVDVVADVIVAHLPEGPALYPDGELTDEPEQIMIAELVREAALEGVRDELPHSLAVVVEEIAARPDREGMDPLLDVHVWLYVERESQKGIVIGKGGVRLREVGTEARRQIEALLGQRVHLDLRVKVAKDWQRDPKQLQRLGF